MLVNYLVAEQPLSARLNENIRLVVFLLDINRNLVSTAPSTLGITLYPPDGSTPITGGLAGGQVKAGSGALGTSVTPAGSWYYDHTTTGGTAAGIVGKWYIQWASTGPAAFVSSSFQLLDVDRQPE